MLNKGLILNEFGETVGKYWYRSGQGRFTRLWLGIRQDGYTEQGLVDWANHLEYQLQEV